VLLAIGASLLVAPATASAINTVGFSSIGNMTTARDFPGAASLPDGRVLIVGGGLTTFTDPQTSAEIFDPKTNTFSAAGVGSMAVPRYGPATASLPDGRILVAGGYNGSDDVASAEVFDPASGTFSAVGSMSAAREGAATALLPDGRLLVAGGAGNSSASLDSSEIFDPKTNTFSPGPSLPQGVDAPASAPLSQGRTLIAGGYTTDYSAGSVVFTPPATFTSAGSLAVQVYGPAGAALPQGRALVAGGYDGTVGGYLDNAEIFDPQTNTFSSLGVGKLLNGLEEAAGAALPDGRALVAGGFDETGALATAEVLSVPSSSFTTKLKGRKVKFSVTTEGVGQVTDVSTKVATTAKKKKKKKPKLVKTTSKHGGPGTIVVKIKLTKRGSAKLRQKGKLGVRVVYTPDGGLATTTKVKLRAGK
jgi:Kelch motif/Galactose oxidase, central domain